MRIETDPIGGSVLGAIQSGLSRATLTRGAIAYWTVATDFLGPDLPRVLAAPGSFLCVDIHLPTSIDHLVALRRTGANVYLHLYDLAGQTEDPGIKGLPPHLMHAKMLLFDLPDGKAALWVGSHNATQRALRGINIEASLVLDLHRSSDAYRQAVAVLEAIRARCSLMDPALANYYKWLQSGERTEFVIELEDVTDAPMTRSTITVFGTDTEDHRQLDKVGKNVLVSITSSNTGRERFYEARIAQTGEMARASRAGKGTTFDPRRYAFRRGAMLPVLEPPGPIPPAVYDAARYFVTLELRDGLPEDTVALEAVESPRWLDLEGGDLSDRFERKFTGRKGDRAPRIRKAAPPEARKFDALPLEQRKEIKEHRLVRRRVFIGPSDGD